MEDFEDECTATQSTWKGCESDDEPDAEAPNTPPRKVSVVVYTPSKTWILADDDADAATSSRYVQPREDFPAGTGDDNTSVFSMNQYSSADEDHTGDGLDEPDITPKVTRSRNQAAVFHQLDPITPRNKRGSSSSSSTSEKKSVSLPRDSKGRFVSTGSAKSRSRKNSLPWSSADVSLARDSKGRFAPTSGDTPAKRRASVGSSAAEKTPRTLFRDEHGKFARKKATPANTSAKRRASMGSSNLEPGSLKRDSGGRFAHKKETPAQPTQDLVEQTVSTSSGRDEDMAGAEDGSGELAPEQTPVPPAKASKLARMTSSQPEASREDEEQSAPKSAPKYAKAKKATAKSPYFVPPTPPTPPISPELTRERTGRKRKRSDPVDAPTTPRKAKDIDYVPGSQGSASKRPPAKIVSCIPFPPLSAPHFGLIQEKLAHDPFRLLIAVTFLIRTHGKHAIPVFFELMEKYPTPESLVAAENEDIVHIIRHLGLQNQRANTYQMYARIWMENPPIKGKRYPVRGYPNLESAKDIKKGDILSDEDERDAWEIGHMTQGPYAIDSWRIFCRDKLRGEADGWNGEGRAEGFQPEWMRVLPEDKELRAYLRWMWLKEGFEWDPFTGDKDAARPELMRAAMEGRIAWDDQGGMRILDEPMSESMSASPSKSNTDAETSPMSTPRVRESGGSEDELA